MDSYGVGVRAGAITPSIADEEAFRSEAGLPVMSEEVKKSWNEDKGVRRPITLTQADGKYPSIQPQPEED